MKREIILNNQTKKKKKKKKRIPMYAEKFMREKHEKYCLELDKTQDLEAIGYFLRDHLKIAGGYWCLTALETLSVFIPLRIIFRLIWVQTRNKS